MTETPAIVTPFRPFGPPMPRIQHNAELNRLVVDLGCSLLQFVGEVSPWSPTNAVAARDTVLRLLEEQRQHVALLVGLLTERRWPVEFGVYPADFTDLHFLSLNAMLPRIIENQNAIVAELDETLRTCTGDAGAVEVLNTVLGGELAITEALKGIVIG
jgi:hypothetical protein